MFKKLAINVCCVAMVATICTPAVMAANHSKMAQVNGISEPKREESEWCYAVFEGVLHKRLWSITYGIWLTEWIAIPSGT